MKWTIVWRLYKRKSPPERGLVMRGSNGKIDLRDWKDKVGSLPLDFLAESSQGRRPHRICRPQITKDLADRILRGCAGFDPLQKADEGPVGRVLVVGKFGHFQTTQNHQSHTPMSFFRASLPGIESTLSGSSLDVFRNLWFTSLSLLKVQVRKNNIM